MAQGPERELEQVLEPGREQELERVQEPGREQVPAPGPAQAQAGNTGPVKTKPERAILVLTHQSIKPDPRSRVGINFLFNALTFA